MELEYSFIDQVIGFFSGILNSKFFLVIKFILGVYIIVLLIDIVLLLLLRGLGGDIRVGMMGIKMPTKSKGKMVKKWSAITQRLESGNSSQYKVSILEADAIVEDVLDKIGYSGENMTERLADINPIQVENIEELRAAHEVRNDIVYNQEHEVTLEEARNTIAVFEKFLHDLDVM
ncbi:hypothetical protein ACFL2R_01505 [Patescibacteria group bacterium]